KETDTADLSIRKTDPSGAKETTAAAYDRFRGVSDALREYLSLAFSLGGPIQVDRPPIKNVHDPSKVSDSDLLARIPETERLGKGFAVELITLAMNADGWRARHPGWTLTAEQTYFRVLRDYELVRIPMVRGNPSESPGSTRDPVHGFLDNRK